MLREHGIVIFDSVAKFLPGMVLSEDSPADFTKFVEAVIDPLRNAAVTTVVADNVGHEARNRARGASSKRDHVDVELLLRRTDAFDGRTCGRVEIRREKSRPGAHYGPWELELGGGHYGSIRGGEAEPLKPRPPFRPTILMERISRTVEAEPGIARGRSGTSPARAARWTTRASS